MSNVYILEPPTLGKVLLKTSVGDIEIELWSKEAPKACRNFIQLCLEGYYDGLVFHRVVKNFIVQGGDPNGDGTGGESIYGEPFKDEFHQRLKFVRRGLVAMANAGKDDNGSQFFITLAATPELQNLHTIFGKIGGDTIFNVLKFEEGLIKNERPEFPHKILKTEVLNNPFTDIVPRVKEDKIEKRSKKEKKAGVKDFKLLSFGAEAEEDEEESTKVNVKLSGKGKSTHDILDDPKLSSKTIIEEQKEVGEDEEEIDPELQLENIRNKLKSEKKEIKKILASHKHTYDDDSDDERKAAKQRKLDEVRQEIENVKKDYHKNKLKRTTEAEVEKKEENERSSTIQEYQSEFDKYKDKKKEQQTEYEKYVGKKIARDKYKEKQKEVPGKGAGREEYTLTLLANFKNKLQAAKEKSSEDGQKDDEGDDDDVDNNESWMSHELRFKDDAPTLAKDANRKDDDWYEIYDPRNPISKRRRGEMMNKETKK